MSQRQLPGVDRNGVFTEAARNIYYLSRAWANGVLDLCDGFRVLKPTGLFTEVVRCDNCEARSAHGARARTQEPNLPRAADNLHVCGLSLHSLARRSPCGVVSSWDAAPVHWDRLGVKLQSSGGAKPKISRGVRSWQADVVRQSSHRRLDSDCFPLRLASATGDPHLSWLSPAWSVETLAKTTPVKQISLAHRACCNGRCPTGTTGAESKTEHLPFPLRYPLYTPGSYAVQATVVPLRGITTADDTKPRDHLFYGDVEINIHIFFGYRYDEDCAFRPPWFWCLCARCHLSHSLRQVACRILLPEATGSDMACSDRLVASNTPHLLCTLSSCGQSLSQFSLYASLRRRGEHHNGFVFQMVTVDQCLRITRMINALCCSNLPAAQWVWTGSPTTCRMFSAGTYWRF